jgi:hypothetical protein
MLYLESEFLLSVGGTAFCLHQSLSQLMPGLLAALFVVLCMPCMSHVSSMTALSLRNLLSP